MPNVYDLTSTQIQGIIDLLDAGAVTPDQLAAAISAARNSNEQPFPIQQPLISAGTVTVSRVERITIVEVDNGGVSGQTLSTIATSSPYTFQTNDLVLVRTLAGQVGMFLDSAGNINVSGTFYFADSTAYILLIWTGTAFQLLATANMGDPRNGALDRVSGVIDNATGEITLVVPANIIEAESEKTAETLATASVTFTGAGAAGRYTTFVDLGFGAIEIGAYDYAAFEPVNDLATNLSANINAGAGIHGFTSVAVGAAVTITAPAGSGAAGNGYTLSESNTGGCTTALIGFAGGIDGAFQDESLANIIGLQANTLAMVKNVMPANTITILPFFAFTNVFPVTLNPGDYAIVVADALGAIDVVTVSSGSAKRFVQTAVAYAMTVADYYLECTAGGFTVTLPSAFGIAGKELAVKNSSGANVTVDADGVETIDGNLTVVLLPLDSITIVSNGVNWIIV